jgi:uncharacterized protein (DUF488 family)
MTPSSADGALTVWTVGHSNRTEEAFISVLLAHEIELVVDVRRFPGSRRLPHFSSEALERSLGNAGVAMRWLPSLGGRRTPRKDTPNTAWRVAGFRGYADHIESEEFADGLFELVLLAYGLRTTVMCAEVLWWQCHRRLISDVLVSLGVTVLHIRDDAEPEAHRIAAPGRLVDGQLTYASDTQLALI